MLKIDGDIYEQLNKLDALRKSGMLTEQEFDAQKKRILAP
jgi:Short C-terminal domain